MFMRTIRASYTVFFFCNYNCFPSIVLAIAVLCFFAVYLCALPVQSLLLYIFLSVFYL